MTRVDFYVIDNADQRQHQALVCRLTEKAWSEGHEVHIRCDGEASANTLDDLLWTFKDTSFLPHALANTSEASGVPVVISHDNGPPANSDVLINLGPDVPDYFSRFTRVMETTGSSDASRAKARERYRYYQERGYILNTHKLDPRNGR